MFFVTSFGTAMEHLLRRTRVRPVILFTFFQRGAVSMSNCKCFKILLHKKLHRSVLSMPFHYSKMFQIPFNNAKVEHANWIFSIAKFAQSSVEVHQHF